MPFNLPLPKQLAGVWKVKIFDAERGEPPHVTIVQGKQLWRLNLRTKEFMDRKPSLRLVPQAVMEAITAHWDLLVGQWDRMFPNNPVEGSEDEEA